MTRVHSGEQPTTALNLNLVLVRPTKFSTGNSTQQYILNLVPVQLSHLLNLNLAIKVSGYRVQLYSPLEPVQVLPVVMYTAVCLNLVPVQL